MTLRATRPGTTPKKSKKNETPEEENTGSRSLFMRAFMWCVKWGFVLGVWAALCVFGVAAWYARELPEITRSPQTERKPSITVLANDGSVIARYGDIKGDTLTIDQMPKYLIDAVLATEDRRFYKHFGVDPVGMARAVVVNVTHKGVVQGGSTITQQLAKNLFLTQDRTFKRKIQEAMLALWLEHKFTKDEILATYLNRVYMGAGAYGVDAAAHVYFKKSARDLNLQESAILAGLLKAPSRYSPKSNPQLADERAKTVINNMVAAGYLNAKELKKSSNLPMPRRKPSTGNSAQYFADWVVEQMDDLIGVQDKDITVETTLDPDIQQAAADNLNLVLQEQGAAKNITQGSIMTMHRDGAVLAMVGGSDYTESEFNRATNALRAPGSSFKPVVYLTALENGFTPDTIVTDEPITEGKYRPTNFDGQYYGDIPLRTALAFSLNTIAVRLMETVGIGPTIDTARRLGITADLQPGLSTALGSNGVPQIQMTSAYATIANGGLGVTPYGINKVVDKDNNVLYQRPPTGELPRMFDRQNIADLTSMMAGVVEFGTGQAAKIGVFAAGKTGTSQDYRDAWFDGFTQRYITTVWVGNDKNTPMKRVTGGAAPATIWRSVMIAALNDPTPAPDEVPASNDSAFMSLIGRVLSSPDDMQQQQQDNAPSFFWWGKPDVKNQEPPARQLHEIAPRYND